MTKEQEYKQKQNGKILIVDDDPDTTLIFKKALMDEGFKQVDTVNDPLLALKNFKAGSYDLLIIDIVMPQMSGRRFADWLHQASPATSVIFVSGYLEESLHPGERTEPGMFFLPKPFDPEQLANKVREALDSTVARPG